MAIIFFSQQLTTVSSFQRLIKMYQHNLDTNITIHTLNQELMYFGTLKALKKYY